MVQCILWSKKYVNITPHANKYTHFISSLYKSSANGTDAMKHVHLSDVNYEDMLCTAYNPPLFTTKMQK
jgi:hypothetical protein